MLQLVYYIITENGRFQRLSERFPRIYSNAAFLFSVIIKKLKVTETTTTTTTTATTTSNKNNEISITYLLKTHKNFLENNQK